jgi:AcrR family transcriptional regulator
MRVPPLRERPRRGNPDETRARLVATAAAVFNRVGYDGTDSNRLARAAGYAPGTFYKHFSNKRAIFLAAYERWVTAEWAAVERALTRPGSAATRAARIVALTAAHHRRWRGLRASLRALVVSDPEARAFHRAQRRRQLALMAALRGRRSSGHDAAADVVLLLAMERVCDAAADGELRDLGLGRAAVLARLRAVVRDHLGDRPPLLRRTIDSGSTRAWRPARSR